MISSSTNKTDLFTTPGTGPFPFTFKVDLAADLEVVTRAVSGIETTLTYITDYSVSLNADQESNPGGTYTLVTAIVSGEKTMARRVVEATQGTDIQNAGGFLPEVIEKALDKLTALCQQNAEEVGRCVKVDLSATESPDAMLDRVEAIVAAAVALDQVAVAPFMETLLDDTTAGEACTTLGARQESDDVRLAAGKVITGEGTTEDAFETTLSFGDPTADRTVTLPDKSGTVAVTADTAIFAAAAAAARPYQSVISYTGTGGITAKGAVLSKAPATVIPRDDTIPQNTEGDAVLDVTITPSAAGAVIEVEFNVTVENESAASVAFAFALFRDSTANAEYVVPMSIPSGFAVPVCGAHRITAPDTTPITFKLRGGTATTPTLSYNSGSAATYGAILNGFIKATEIAYA